MGIVKDERKIKEVLTERVVEVLPQKETLLNLMKKRKIRVYVGIDPTGRRLHLGHLIQLRKLQEFANLGHEAILLIGTGTVLAGDPSEREEARKKISQKEIKENVRSIKKQIKKVIDLKKIKIKYNGDWLLKLKLKDIINIASHLSAIRLFQREMFQRRLKKGDTVWFHEVLYPLLQGYDSVAMNVDLEIGGTDQLFNMLIGRELVQKILKKEKYVLTTPMILGIDGQPMSKTRGNGVWLDDPPEEIFGKIMSIPDSLLLDYLKLCGELPQKEINIISKKLKKKEINPRDLKIKLAEIVVERIYNKTKAKKAKREFERVFKEKKLPSKIPKVGLKEKVLDILDLLVKTKLVTSRSEARRLIEQGGVRINGEVEKDWRKTIKIKKGMIIQIGKRRFVEIK